MAVSVSKCNVIMSYRNMTLWRFFIQDLGNCCHAGMFYLFNRTCTIPEVSLLYLPVALWVSLLTLLTRLRSSRAWGHLQHPHLQPTETSINFFSRPWKRVSIVTNLKQKMHTGFLYAMKQKMHTGFLYAVLNGGYLHLRFAFAIQVCVKFLSTSCKCKR